MKTIKFYEVRYESYSNPVESDAFETMELASDAFETRELAKEFAKNSKSAMYCRLYEITMVFNGTVTREENYITGLKTSRHNDYIENEKWGIEAGKRQIKEIENNKRTKAENKAKQIANFENCIARKEKTIKEYYETYK